MLVECRMSAKMKSANGGALLFDGSTCGNVHYVGAIASYCAKVAGGTTIKPRLAVIAVSPMGQVTSESDKDVDAEA